MPLSFMEKEIKNDEPTRIIAGGVCTGKKVTLDDSIGYQDYALHVIRDGYEQELLSFLGQVLISLRLVKRTCLQW